MALDGWHGVCGALELALSTRLFFYFIFGGQGEIEHRLGWVNRDTVYVLCMRGSAPEDGSYS